MMEIEVTVTEQDQEYFIGNISLVDFTKLNVESLKLMHMYIKEYGCGKWLNDATYQAFMELDNCSKKMIREAQAELVKAKQFIKTHYPVRYKFAFIKVILKNPFKTLIAKCLLKSK